MESKLRPVIQPLISSLSSSLPLFMSPNYVTLFGFISACGASAAISQQYLITGLFFILLCGFFDILDGTIARMRNIATPVGAYIDLICDRLSEIAIIIGFARGFPEYSFLYIIFLGAVLFHFSTFLAASSLIKNNGTKSIHYEESLIERAEAFVVFSAMCLIPNHIFALLFIFNIGVIITAMTRFYRIINLD